MNKHIGFDDDISLLTMYSFQMRELYKDMPADDVVKWLSEGEIHSHVGAFHIDSSKRILDDLGVGQITLMPKEYFGISIHDQILVISEHHFGLQYSFTIWEVEHDMTMGLISPTYKVKSLRIIKLTLENLRKGLLSLAKMSRTLC
jgi:hypothetical protein